jgi:DNA-binding transcriptional MerR regulator
MAASWLGPRALADASGVSPDTIRHYERLGLLPRAVRTSSGYRRFPPDSADRVLLIQRALTVGFSLRELAAVLERRERGEPPCRRVRALVGARLASLETRLAELTALRDEMRRLVRDWDARLAQTPHGQRARLLDVLAVRPLRASRRSVIAQ